MLKANISTVLVQPGNQRQQSLNCCMHSLSSVRTLNNKLRIVQKPLPSMPYCIPQVDYPRAHVPSSLVDLQKRLSSPALPLAHLRASTHPLVALQSVRLRYGSLLAGDGLRKVDDEDQQDALE
jgi:hypothetical protein